MKRLFAFVLILVMMLSVSTSVLSVGAADYGCDVDITAKYAYMEDLNTGTVVHSLRADEQAPPASLTKIMTYIVVTENVPDLENTYVTITEEALEGFTLDSSFMGVFYYMGEQFSVLELLYGLMLPSGNDAALVLADYVGDGSVEKFVDMMNRKAGQLGCSDTHFVNPHGLHDPMHYTTASDLAVITKYALEKPYFKEIVKTKQYRLEGREIIENTNYLLDPARPEYYYDKATGVKTGYTDEAGKCLISTSESGEYSYLCIVLGTPFSYAENVNYAMLDSVALYEWAFDGIAYSSILSSEEIIDTLAVEFVWGDAMADIVPQQEVTALLPVDYDHSLVTTKVDIPEHLRAPVEQGEVVGSITVFYDGEEVGTTDLISKQGFERDKSNYMMHRMIGFVVNNIIWLTIVFAIVVVVFVVGVNNRRNRRRRQARRRYR